MANHRLTTDWANRLNVVYVCDAGIYRVSPTRVWVGVGNPYARPGTGWDYDGYTQTEKIAVHRFGGRLDTRSVMVGDTFPVD